MEAQETATAEEVLRTAAVEVSTTSAERRVLLFRHTLPPLLAKATESEIKLLVDFIFQTLPSYVDRASRKAVDDMVIRALNESTFVKPFSTTLVQYMAKSVEVTGPLACFKLLRWSSYIMLSTQFASVYKGSFCRMANAQAVLSQFLLDSSFRGRWNLKYLLRKSVKIYKMYVEEVRGSSISARNSPAFINAVLDVTIASPSLLSEYKPLFLDLYVNTILNSNDALSEAASEAFKPLLLHIGQEDFENAVFPSCIKMLTKNPGKVLQRIGYLLMTCPLDLSNYSLKLLPFILQQARLNEKGGRTCALNIVATLSDKSSDPETRDLMFYTIKANLEGSEGKLSPPARVGMLNALGQLSRFPAEQICRLARSASALILTFYNDGNEEVKLAALSALGSWALVSPEVLQPSIVSVITAGLKEKDTLRKGHLKLIRFICKNSGSLTKITSLLDHLIQLSKTGFSEATQRLNGIYALYAISRLATIDAKADGSIVKEKLWTLIAQSEPSVISVQLLSKLTDEDCLTCLDLLQSLLVDHLFRVQEYFSIQSLLQVLIYLVCHPSWAVRKIAYDATKKVLSSSVVLAKDLLFLFTDWLSLVLLKRSAMDNSGDSQLPFIPSTDVLVNCLFLIAHYAGQRSYSRLILCSHHPCISSSGSPAGVWKRWQRRLKKQNISLTDLIFPNISVICKELLSHDGLFSSNKQEQHAALCSLSTLMTISPNDTFVEFEKHFTDLPYRALHDGFSENDIKIFFTSEQSELAKNEASVRKQVGDVQKNLALMLVALGELATVDPAHIRDQLPRLVDYIVPLLNSPIVSDVALRAMMRLTRCTGPPVCKFAVDIAVATSVMATYGEESKKRLLSSLCEAGALPVDSFVLTFPIMEDVLFSSRITSLHQKVLDILSKHLSPKFCLPRPRIFSALYHVLCVSDTLYPSVEPMLNELCKGLKCSDLEQALVGIYSKDVKVRIACLTAIQFVHIHSVQEDIQGSQHLWIAVHDPEQVVADLALKLWRRFRFKCCMVYPTITDAHLHKNYNVRAAAAEALSAALKLHPDKAQETLSSLFLLYEENLGSGEDTKWYCREGISLALHSVAGALGSKELFLIMEFLISHVLADPNLDVRDKMINAGTIIIDKLGKQNCSLLFPLFESYLKKRDSEDLVRQGIVLLTDAIVEYLPKGDDAKKTAVDKLLAVQIAEACPPPDRTVHLDFEFVKLLEHMNSVAIDLFGVVRLEGKLGIGLSKKYFVSLGFEGSNIYDMLFELVEYRHAREECLDRFVPNQIMYIPSLRRLVFTADVKVIKWSKEAYRNNIRDVGGVLNLLRFNDRKVATKSRDPNIFELDRSVGVLPPYLEILLAKIRVIGSERNQFTAKWRSTYRCDLAGKTCLGRIAVMEGVDLHKDHLKKPQKDPFKTAMGGVDVNWKLEAEGVPSMKAVLDFKQWDRNKNKAIEIEYDGDSLHSLYQCGRNQVTHSDKEEMSEIEAEAIFSNKFHRDVSKIPHRLLTDYMEPQPVVGDGNRARIKDIVSIRN